MIHKTITIFINIVAIQLSDVASTPIFTLHCHRTNLTIELENASANSVNKNVVYNISVLNTHTGKVVYQKEVINLTERIYVVQVKMEVKYDVQVFKIPTNHSIIQSHKSCKTTLPNLNLNFMCEVENITAIWRAFSEETVGIWSYNLKIIVNNSVISSFYTQNSSVVLYKFLPKTIYKLQFFALFNRTHIPFDANYSTPIQEKDCQTPKKDLNLTFECEYDRIHSNWSQYASVNFGKWWYIVNLYNSSTQYQYHLKANSKVLTNLTPATNYFSELKAVFVWSTSFHQGNYTAFLTNDSCKTFEEPLNITLSGMYHIEIMLNQTNLQVNDFVYHLKNEQKKLKINTTKTKDHIILKNLSSGSEYCFSAKFRLPNKSSTVRNFFKCLSTYPLPASNISYKYINHSLFAEWDHANKNVSFEIYIENQTKYTTQKNLYQYHFSSAAKVQHSTVLYVIAVFNNLKNNGSIKILPEPSTPRIKYNSSLNSTTLRWHNFGMYCIFISKAVNVSVKLANISYYTIQSLVPGHEYFFDVYNDSCSRTSPTTPQIRFKAVTKPAAVLNLSFNSETNDLEWRLPNGNRDKYKIYIVEVENKSHTILNQSESAGSSLKKFHVPNVEFSMHYSVELTTYFQTEIGSPVSLNFWTKPDYVANLNMSTTKKFSVLLKWSSSLCQHCRCYTFILTSKNTRINATKTVNLTNYAKNFHELRLGDLLHGIVYNVTARRFVCKNSAVISKESFCNGMPYCLSPTKVNYISGSDKNNYKPLINKVSLHNRSFAGKYCIKVSEEKQTKLKSFIVDFKTINNISILQLNKNIVRGIKLNISFWTTGETSLSCMEMEKKSGILHSTIKLKLPPPNNKCNFKKNEITAAFDSHVYLKKCILTYRNKSRDKKVISYSKPNVIRKSIHSMQEKINFGFNFMPWSIYNFTVEPIPGYQSPNNSYKKTHFVCRSLTSRPSKVRNLRVTEESNKFHISWNKSEYPNGELLVYTIRYKGVRQNLTYRRYGYSHIFPIKRGSFNVSKSNFSTSISLDKDRKDGYTYTFEIAAVNEDYVGYFASKDVVLRTMKPTVNKKFRTVRLKTSGKYQVALKFDCATFNEVIYYYTVIVSQKNCKIPKVPYSWLNAIRSRYCCYQTENIFIPKSRECLQKKKGYFTFVIGREKRAICSSVNPQIGYCNGPITIARKFDVFLRGYTMYESSSVDKRVYTDVKVGSYELSETAKEKKPIRFYLQAIAFGMLFVALIFFFLALLLSAESRKKELREQDIPTIEINEENFPSMSTGKEFSTSSDMRRNSPINSRKFQIDEFVRNFASFLEDSVHENDFKDIKKVGLNHPISIACHPKNESKNLYKQILPFDKNIVAIKDEAKRSLYINASWISTNRKKSFIATQMPLETTVNDFWTMIQQYDVTAIVSLTKPEFHYWPPMKRTCKYGNIKVTTVEEVIHTMWKKYYLEINYNGKTSTVERYYFTGFSKHGICSDSKIPIFAHFIYVIYKKYKNWKSPILAHCRAGIGKTAIFIAAFMILENFECKGLYIDVKRTVADLREQRICMIQSEQQYLFLNKLCFHLIQKIEKLRRTKQF